MAYDIASHASTRGSADFAVGHGHTERDAVLKEIKTAMPPTHFGQFRGDSNGPDSEGPRVLKWRRRRRRKHYLSFGHF